MPRLPLAILLLLPLSVLAQTQVPNVFEDGTPATAAEVNENFQYVLENASGGCSVEQVDNTAEITCADGTTAVVPGYGTVVVYPEGEVGIVDPDTYNEGDIVVRDSNGVVLAKALEAKFEGVFLIELPVQGDPREAVLFNNPETQAVELISWNGATLLNASTALFLTEDCSGTAWIAPSRQDITLGFVAAGMNLYYVVVSGAEKESLLFSSRIRGAHYSYVGEFREASSCEIGDYIYDAFLAVTYTPAPEILNAAYPVRLEQLP